MMPTFPRGWLITAFGDARAAPHCMSVRMYDDVLALYSTIAALSLLGEES